MYKVIKSPKRDKKYRVISPDNKTIDFGAKGYSDYTLHKNPFRMRLYVGRHGGKIPQYLRTEIDKKKVHSKMMNVSISTKENWTKSGIMTAGFWSRWLLWSDPNLDKAKNEISKKFKITIK